MEKEATERLVGEVVKDFRSNRRWVWLRRFGLTAMFLLAFVTGLWSFIVKVGIVPTFGESVAVVTIKGEIMDGAVASADRVIPALRSAFKDEDAKAVILEIDSPGGSPFEAERINTELAALRKEHPKPVVAVINTMGASAGYMIAVHADRIVAGRYSLVGSIGIIASAWDVSGLAKRYDIQQESFASGPLKDMFNPLRPRSEAERVKAKAMVGSFAKVFVEEVRKARGSKLKVQDFASGEAWTGDEALAMGLIDEIGTIDSVAHHIGLPASYRGPATRPGLLADFRGAIADGVAQGFRSLASQSVEIR